MEQETRLAPRSLLVPVEDENQIWKEAEDFFSQVLECLGYDDPLSVYILVGYEDFPVLGFDLSGFNVHNDKRKILNIRGYRVADVICYHESESQLRGIFLLCSDFGSMYNEAKTY